MHHRCGRKDHPKLHAPEAGLPTPAALYTHVTVPHAGFAAIQDDIALWCLGDRVPVPIAQVSQVAQNENSPTIMIPIRDSSQGVNFAVKVHPRAKKSAITGELGDALKLSLTTPPVEGRANEACIEFLAKLLKVQRSSVTIASGQSSRNKVIRVTGLPADEVRRRLYEAE